MSKIFAVDSSCIVPAVCFWHTHHAAAFAEIERRLTRGERLSVSTQALTESYSVLTRLPAPYRLSPVDAWTLVEANFVKERHVVALDAAKVVNLLGKLAKDGVSGGQTYDALISACATASKASTLLTFNQRHFEPPPDGISIVVPSA